MNPQTTNCSLQLCVYSFTLPGRHVQRWQVSWKCLLLEDGVIYWRQLTPSSISIITYYSSDHTQPHPITVNYTCILILIIYCTYEVWMFTDISHFRADCTCVKVSVSHQRHVGIQPDASMDIFGHVLSVYFASLSSGFPILVQVFLRLCATQQGVFLDQKHFKECEDWQKGLLLSYKQSVVSLTCMCHWTRCLFWTRSVLKRLTIFQKGLLLS